MVSEAASSFLVVQDLGATGWCCRLAQSEHAICKRMFEGSELMGGRLSKTYMGRKQTAVQCAARTQQQSVFSSSVYIKMSRAEDIFVIRFH